MKRFVVTILILFAAVQLQAANDFSGDADCVSLWSLESGAFGTDSIGTVTLTNNGVTASATHKEKTWAGDFELTDPDYLNLADASLPAGFPLKSGTSNTTISVCFWVQFESMPDGTSLAQFVYGKYTLAGNLRSFGIAARYDTGNVRMAIYHGSSAGTVFTALPHGSNLQTGRWYHVGVTYRDSDLTWRIRIWDDTAGAILGTDATSPAPPAAISLTTAQLCLGSRSDNLYYLDGLLDEVVVFKDVLTAGEIDQIRQGTYGAPGGGSTRRRVILTQ